MSLKLSEVHNKNLQFIFPVHNVSELYFVKGFYPGNFFLGDFVIKKWEHIAEFDCIFEYFGRLGGLFNLILTGDAIYGPHNLKA